LIQKGIKEMAHTNLTDSIYIDPSRSILLRFTRKILALLSELESRRKLRRWLAGMTDQKLRDIGLTRADVVACCSYSLKLEVGEELRKIAKSRSGNW
jgi:uncharacterized protein YjiS (DUF1127 family)